MKTDKPFRKAFACALVWCLFSEIAGPALSRFRSYSRQPPFHDLKRVLWSLGIWLVVALVVGLWARRSQRAWSWSAVAVTEVVLFLIVMAVGLVWFMIFIL